jgi:hypothetical protein
MNLELGIQNYKCYRHPELVSGSPGVLIIDKYARCKSQSMDGQISEAARDNTMNRVYT